MVMSWLSNRWRFTSTASLSGGVLAQAVWERKVLMVLLLCIELMGKSERGEELLCSASPSTGFEASSASDAQLYPVPSPCLCLLFLHASNLLRVFLPRWNTAFLQPGSPRNSDPSSVQPSS